MTFPLAGPDCAVSLGGTHPGSKQRARGRQALPKAWPPVIARPAGQGWGSLSLNLICGVSLGHQGAGPGKPHWEQAGLGREYCSVIKPMGAHGVRASLGTCSAILFRAGVAARALTPHHPNVHPP